MPFAVPNGTGVLELATYVNDVTFNMFWAFVVFFIFIIAFIKLKDFETGKAFLAAAFLTAVMTILLRWANLVSDFVVGLVLMGFVAGLIGMWISSNGIG